MADTDDGKTFTVRVSFTDDAGNEESLPSEATDAVTAPLAAILENMPNTHDGKIRVDSGRGQDRTLRGKVPVESAIDGWS